MIEEEKIVGIIQKKLDGNLSSAEANELNEWLAVPANAAAYAEYEQLWSLTTSLVAKKENYTPNTFKAWEAIQEQIVADKPKRKFRLGYAAAASVALLFMLLGGNYIFNSSNTSENIQLVLQANEKDTLTFSDGSQAYLFGPCSISYPQAFASNERIVSMDGFVYFDIARDETRPFEINTTNGKVEVLGTSFTVDTRKPEVFTVQCISGKVRMTGGKEVNKCETILTKNLMATYTNQSQRLDVSPFEMADLSIAIPVRNLVFNNKPLREILERIENKYAVSIQLDNKDLSETKYSTTITDSTLDDFFKELKVTFNVDVIQTKPSTYILKREELN